MLPRAAGTGPDERIIVSPLHHAPTAPAATGATESTAGAPRPRLVWADAAKGLCILLVVLHHSTVKHLPSVLPAELGAVGEAWLALTAALKPIRMPLFFLLSGLFAAGALRRPWAQVLTARVLTPYWVYAVWLGVIAVVFSLERTMVTNRTQGVGDLLGDLVFASTGVWFLYALAVYFLLAKALLRWDLRWVVAGSAALAVSVSGLPMAAANREAVLVHFVYFLVGARLPELVHRLSSWRAVPTSALVVGYAGAVAGSAALEVPLSVEVTALSLLGVPLAVRVARATAGLPRVGAAVATLGRRTLPVYVLHMPLLALVHHLPGPAAALDALATPAGSTGTVLGGLAVAVYPLLVTAVVTAASLGLHRLLVGLGLAGLFTLPGTLRPSAETLQRTSLRLRRALAHGRARWAVGQSSRLRADPPSHGVTRVLAIR